MSVGGSYFFAFSFVAFVTVWFDLPPGGTRRPAPGGAFLAVVGRRRTVVWSFRTGVSAPLAVVRDFLTVVWNVPTGVRNLLTAVSGFRTGVWNLLTAASGFRTGVRKFLTGV